MKRAAVLMVMAVFLLAAKRTSLPPLGTKFHALPSGKLKSVGGDQLLSLSFRRHPGAATPDGKAVDSRGRQDDSLGRRGQGIRQADHARLSGETLRAGKYELRADSDSTGWILVVSCQLSVASCRLPVAGTSVASAAAVHLTTGNRQLATISRYGLHLRYAGIRLGRTIKLRKAFAFRRSATPRRHRRRAPFRMES